MCVCVCMCLQICDTISFYISFMSCSCFFLFLICVPIFSICFPPPSYVVLTYCLSLPSPTHIVDTLPLVLSIHLFLFSTFLLLFSFLPPVRFPSLSSLLSYFLVSLPSCLFPSSCPISLPLFPLASLNPSVLFPNLSSLLSVFFLLSYFLACLPSWPVSSLPPFLKKPLVLMCVHERLFVAVTAGH